MTKLVKIFEEKLIPNSMNLEIPKIYLTLLHLRGLFNIFYLEK